MKRQVVVPDAITSNALIGACAKGSQPEQAWSLAEAMWCQGMCNVPDTVTYNALISACEKSRWAERAFKAFHALQR